MNHNKINEIEKQIFTKLDIELINTLDTLKKQYHTDVYTAKFKNAQQKVETYTNMIKYNNLLEDEEKECINRIENESSNMEFLSHQYIRTICRNWQNYTKLQVKKQ